MDIVKFSERLYTLDVGEVPKKEVPRIIDPNDLANKEGTVVCYCPTEDQLIQLALTIWQVATKERNALNAMHVRNQQIETAAEDRVTKTRNVFKSLLLPFVRGNQDKAMDLCRTLLDEQKPILYQYINNWKIIPRPRSVWVDKNARGIFLCENAGRILVGLNPTNYVFAYNQEK